MNSLYIFIHSLHPCPSHPSTSNMLLSITRHYSNSSPLTFCFFQEEGFRIITELCHFIFSPFPFVCEYDEYQGSQKYSCGTTVLTLVRKVSTYSFNQLHIHVSSILLIPVLISQRPFGELRHQKMPSRIPRRLYQLYSHTNVLVQSFKEL